MKTRYNLISFAALAFLLAAACGGKGGGGGESRAGDAVGNPAGAAPLWRGFVAAMDLNFRTAPDAEAAPVAGREVLYWGVELGVLEEKGDWLRVRLDDGKEGWLRREFEGTAYVKRVINKDVYADEGPGEKPLSSREFLKWADEEGRKWDEGAKLSFLCGDRGGLDGLCHGWIAFYRSTGKPGKKFVCSHNVFNLKFDKWHGEEWGEDWVYLDGKKRDDDLGIAPGPTWWDYEDARVTGRDFISSAELCSPANVKTIIEKGAAACGGKAAFARQVNDCKGFNYYVDGGSWVVTTGSGYTGYLTFAFDARTGGFSRFEDGRY